MDPPRLLKATVAINAPTALAYKPYKPGERLLVSYSR